MHGPSIYPPYLSYWLVVDFHDIRWGGSDAIERDLDGIIFSPIALTILKW
jgi:hypothetical protein